MNSGKNSITCTSYYLYDLVKGSTVIVPNFQRGYDWGKDQAFELLEEIAIAAAPNCPPDKQYPNWDTIMVHFVDNNQDQIAVADGHTRIVTYKIFIQALRDVCTNSSKLIRIKLPEDFMIYYEVPEAKVEYEAYLANATGKTKYAAIYKLAYKFFKNKISTQAEAKAYWDVITKRVSIIALTYDSMKLAHQAFLKRNATGKRLDEKQIAASLLRAAMFEFDIDLKYNYTELKQLVEGYYYGMYEGKKGVFSNNVVRSFMEKHVTDSAGHLKDFKEYVDRVNEFKKTAWYTILKLLGDKNLKLAYVMLSKNIKLDGSNKKATKLLESIVVFDIAAYAHAASHGGTISGFFKKLNTLIGGCDEEDDKKVDEMLDIVTTVLYDFVEKNKYSYGNRFEIFSMSLDNLKDDIKQAVLMFTYMRHNRNSLPTSMAYDHAYPQNPAETWYANKMFPAENSAEQIRMINCLGNLVMLDKITNQKASNASFSEKKFYYDQFYDGNDAYSHNENFFSHERFEMLGQAYLNERRDAFAKVLSNTTIGQILTSI